MEALSAKLAVFASLFGVLGLLGLAFLLVSVIWLVIRVANWDSILPALLCVLLSIGLTAGGLVLSPAPDYQPEPLKMPWEILLDWVSGLRDGKGKNEDPPEDGAPADQSEQALTVSSAEPVGIPLDEVLSGWHVRLTLPEEWKDSYVVENDGTYLYFYQEASKQDYGGLVFFLVVMPSPVDLDSPEYWHMDGHQIVAEKDGAALISAGPTDVQFNAEVQEISDEYHRMREEIPSILSTVQFERA